MKRLLTTAAAVAAMSAVPSAAGAQSATPAISLIHGIPGSTVDLVVDGTVVLDAFAPGSIVDITSFAGRTLENVEVVDDGGDTVIGPIPTLEVPDSGNWSLIAHLDAGGEATLSSFENNLADTSNDQARLTLRHTAEAPNVDLVIGDQRPITNAANKASAEVELPSGQLADASIALAAGNSILEIDGVNLAANTNTVIYVVGSAEADTLDYVVQIIELPLAAPATTTTTVAGSTTTSTGPTPSAVDTGSPIGGSSTTATLLVVALGGLALAGGSYLVRRRV